LFKFKLQTILNLRKTLEEKVLLEFSDEQKRLGRENDRLQTIRSNKMALTDELRDIKGKVINISEITLNADGIVLYRKQEEIQREQVKEAVKRVDLKREALFEAMKQRKSMEKVKSRRFEQHLAETDLLERTAIDEMVIVRHNRRKQG
jgi:flagellar FliJ protein